ncbi:MAG: helix-turn-helix domain-containing protein [Bifidobacteriaceae bacterium]|nr:helix-turn-helix domain-containing protein [Bifidobacteriaceae bacterium]
METIETIKTSDIPFDQVDALEQYAETSAEPELRDMLRSLIRCVREGSEFAIIDNSAAVTPNQAAEHLGMSRSHLYKLLDRGEIVFHRVGRDRRIRVRDLLDFEAQRQRDRRELAERFARQNQTRTAAVNELVDLL